MDQLANLTPEQRQQVMQQAAMQANQQIMQDMMTRSVQACFKKCVGSRYLALDVCNYNGIATVRKVFWRPWL